MDTRSNTIVAMAMAGMATTARGRQPQPQDIIIDIVDMAAMVDMDMAVMDMAVMDVVMATASVRLRLAIITVTRATMVDTEAMDMVAMGIMDRSYLVQEFSAWNISVLQKYSSSCNICVKIRCVRMSNRNSWKIYNMPKLQLWLFLPMVNEW